MTLGQIIKSFRTEKKLSQPEFAEQIGIEQSYLSKLENDKSIPSSEIIQSLLNVVGMNLPQFIEEIDSANEIERLKQIPIIAEYFQQQKQHRLINLRRYLYASSLLIVLGICSFYAGFTKQLFSEKWVQYMSMGIVLKNEPVDIFENWKEQTSGFAETTAMKKKMALRHSPQYILEKNFKGTMFITDVPNGKRLFTIAGIKVKSRAINTWLEIIGVFLFASGIMGFVLERKLFKP